MSSKSYVGIDVSKDQLEVFVLSTGGNQTVTNTEEGIASLIPLLQSTDPKLIVLEATGGLERPTAEALTAAGFPVAVVNPRQVRDFAKAKGILAKSDRIDARVLADFGEAIRPEARPPKAPEVQELEALTTRRRQIVDMITVEKNRLGSAPKRTRLQIQEHLRYLGKALKAINQEINKTIKKHPQFREKPDHPQCAGGRTGVNGNLVIGFTGTRIHRPEGRRRFSGRRPLKSRQRPVPWPSVRLGRPGQDSGRPLYGHLGGYPLQSGYPDFL